MNNERQKQASNTYFQESQRTSNLSQFLNKYHQQLVKDISFQKIKANVVPDSNQYLPVLGQIIRSGKLVGFPTETVYGLGADATNQNALLQIYRVKRRPLTDPIIVHVLNTQQALKLVQPTQNEFHLFMKLTKQFWPGPLTIILKANLKVLPIVVTAQTGYVGIRSPKCEYARRLIEESKRPIGAPSANLFSHVSPTSPVHVLNDFYDQEVTIVDGIKCQYGVESTVVKIVEKQIQVLREGSLSTKKLSQFINKQFGSEITITVKKRVQEQSANQGMECPGQLLKHYAPYLPCMTAKLENLKRSKNKAIKGLSENTVYKFDQAVLICFTKQFEQLAKQFKYFLSAQSVDEGITEIGEFQEEQRFCSAQEKKRMRVLYHFLRKAENLDAKVILVGWNQAEEGTLWDKIFRSTQGQTAQLL